MEKHVGEKRMARHDDRCFAVIHGMDGRSVYDGIELALCLHCALDAIVLIHSNSLDPSHSSPLLELAIILRPILNRRVGRAPGLHFARTPAQQSLFRSAGV